MQCSSILSTTALARLALMACLAPSVATATMIQVNGSGFIESQSAELSNLSEPGVDAFSFELLFDADPRPNSTQFSGTFFDLISGQIVIETKRDDLDYVLDITGTPSGSRLALDDGAADNINAVDELNVTANAGAAPASFSSNFDPGGLQFESARFGLRGDSTAFTNDDEPLTADLFDLALYQAADSLTFSNRRFSIRFQDPNSIRLGAAGGDILTLSATIIDDGDMDDDSDDDGATDVPAPGGVPLLVTGIASLWLARRRRG